MPTTTRPRPTSGRSSLWPALAAVAVAAAIALVAAVAWTRGNDEQATGAAEIAHVHGLGVDPADGALYAATHYGVFRLEDDGVEQVSDHAHDFMGFTVVGAGHFLASGHPSPVSDELRRGEHPPLLGLIESTDGGRTWESLSLLGEADFHGLTAAHGRIYGYDSSGSRLMISDDGQDWDVRPMQPVADLAVDPADLERIVATTAEGPTFSTDGGDSWQPDDGPSLVFLDWHADGGLWGLDVDAAVYQHVDGAWERRGQLSGRPEALLVHDGGLFAAVNDGNTAIYHSADGDTWDLVFE